MSFAVGVGTSQFGDEGGIAEVDVSKSESVSQGMSELGVKGREQYTRPK